MRCRSMSPSCYVKFKHRYINKNIPQGDIFIYLVALVGLEPTLIAELDFESSASTNSATGPWHPKTD